MPTIVAEPSIIIEENSALPFKSSLRILECRCYHIVVLYSILGIMLANTKLLTQDEIDRLKQVVSAISRRAFGELSKMPNVALPDENSLLWNTLDDYGEFNYVEPDNTFVDHLSVVEFSDGRGLSVEVELLVSDPEDSNIDCVNLVFEVLNNTSPRTISVHYAYY